MDHPKASLESNVSASEWREKAMRIVVEEVILLGTNLSLLLVEFVFMVSDGEDEKITKTLGLFRTVLEPKIAAEAAKGRELLVFRKLFALFEAAENGAKKMLGLKKLKEIKLGRDEVGPAEGPTRVIIGRLCGEIAEIQAVVDELFSGPLMIGHSMLGRIGACREELGRIAVEAHGLGRKFFMVNAHNHDHEFLRELIEFKVRKLWIDQNLDE